LREIINMMYFCRSPRKMVSRIPISHPSTDLIKDRGAYGGLNPAN
jgi:hypothetical protein